jgi:glycosyltransferase involved in cell wall biosynthesis
VTPNTAKGPFYKDFVIVEWCKLWSGKKAILHFHNKGVSTRQDRWLDNLLYRRFFHHTEVILLGEPLYEDIKKYVDEKRVHYCPNGIGTGTASPPTPLLKARGVATLTEVPRILWLTNIMLTKGLMEFLDALVVLKERNVGFFVDFVGGMTAEITEEQFQQALATRGLETCTQYAGRKYGEEKERFFNGADIFVLPSYTEAFPLTILEAMQHGLPIVATNVGGISTAVENGINGILIGGGKPVMSLDYRPDAQELADALQTLLENGDLRQKMGKAGKERFEQEFTQDRFEQRMVKVLREALNSKK